jgi:putative ABC transport system substrate-binding protein
MRRRDFLAFAFAAGTTASLPRLALSQAGKTERIGFLAALPDNDPADPRFLAAMREGLASQGWVEGQNLQISCWWGNSADTVAAASAKAAVDLRLDATLVAGGTRAALELKKLTNTVPIVHALSDPVGLGEVQNPGHPEANVTGFTLQPASIGGKWIDLLAEIAPGLKQVGWLTDATGSPLTAIAGAEVAARSAGLDLVRLSFSSAADLPKVIGDWASQPGRGLLASGALALTNRKIIVNEVAARHLPAVYEHPLFAEAGGVLTYAPDPFDVLRRAAEYVGLILNGTKVADLPVQDPTKFTLIVNLKAAKDQGLVIPNSILVRADQVIE